MRTLSLIFVVSAVVGLLAAGYDYFFVPPDAPPPPFEISQTDFPLGELEPQILVLQTTIRNASKEPRRILGTQGLCIANCCTKPLQDAAIVVPPGGSAEVRCKVLISLPGPIAAEFKIYLEDNGIRTVTLRVTGTAVEAPRAPK